MYALFRYPKTKPIHLHIKPIKRAIGLDDLAQSSPSTSITTFSSSIGMILHFIDMTHFLLSVSQNAIISKRNTKGNQPTKQ